MYNALSSFWVPLQTLEPLECILRLRTWGVPQLETSYHRVCSREWWLSFSRVWVLWRSGANLKSGGHDSTAVYVLWKCRCRSAKLVIKIQNKSIHAGYMYILFKDQCLYRTLASHNDPNLEATITIRKFLLAGIVMIFARPLAWAHRYFYSRRFNSQHWCPFASLPVVVWVLAPVVWYYRCLRWDNSSFAFFAIGCSKQNITCQLSNKFQLGQDLQGSHSWDLFKYASTVSLYLFSLVSILRTQDGQWDILIDILIVFPLSKFGLNMCSVHKVSGALLSQWVQFRTYT